MCYIGRSSRTFAIPASFTQIFAKLFLVRFRRKLSGGKGTSSRTNQNGIFRVNFCLSCFAYVVDICKTIFIWIPSKKPAKLTLPTEAAVFS